MARPSSLRIVGIVLLCTIAIPASSSASSGGAGLGGGSTGGGSGSQPVTSSPTAVTVSGSDITLSSNGAALLGGKLQFTGTIASAASGKEVVIERHDSQPNGTWITTATATTTTGGSFSAAWSVNHVGHFTVRALIEGGSASTPSFALTVYRPSIATLYGPGLYGHRTACGAVLERDTLGVANRTLKCGTSVSFYFHGRTIVVPVIDRGPYANHASWDLTEATGRLLGMTGTSTLGAGSVPAS